VVAVDTRPSQLYCQPPEIPKSHEYISEETGDEVILMKDKLGKVIGFEKLNFSNVKISPLRVAFETVAV